MVSIRDHNATFDDPGELPLLTESARVAEVAALDEDRIDEVRRVTARLLRSVDRGDLVTDDDPPHVDWDGVDEVCETTDNRLLEKKLTHLADRYQRPYPSLLSVRLHEEREAIDFVPGQYVTIRFHDTPRPYSVASSPNRSDLDFCIRRVPGGRLTTDLFESLEPGDEVVVRGPNGDFVMEDPSSRDVAFLATGTGVAPLKSMIEYTFEEGQDVHEGEARDIWLFLGCSWQDDLPYRERFADLDASHDNFHFVPTLSRESYLTEWHGETSYVQQTFMKYLADGVETDVDGDLADYLDESPETDVEARLDPANLEVYACGVSAMVHTLVDAARSVGIPDQYIDAEGYG
ncbi:MAG: FAD-binding oxidoreductase [Haloarculaceae archaeon]